MLISILFKMSCRCLPIHVHLSVGWSDGGESCMIQIEDTLAIPLITHYEECICSEIRNNETLLDACSTSLYVTFQIFMIPLLKQMANSFFSDQNDILAGLLFYPEETIYEAPKTFDYLAAMYLTRRNDPSQDYVYHQNGYQAMRDMISTTYIGSTEVASDADIKESFKSVCKDNCSLLVFEAWDRSGYEINSYFLQVSRIKLEVC